MKKNFKYALIIFPIFVVVVMYTTRGTYFCSQNELFYTKNIRGTVVQIIPDFDSVRRHPLPTIIIADRNKDTSRLLNYYNEFNFDFYEGDSISKNANNFIFKVYRNDSLVYTPDYYKCDCPYCK